MLGEEKKERHIRQVRNGTAIDHIPSGKALQILGMLGFSGKETVSLALNVESKKLGKKDLIFIDRAFLEEKEINAISLLADQATVNHISESAVKLKTKPQLPELAEGLLLCPNKKCISNVEGIATKFLLKKEPLKAKCVYCETELSEKEIEKSVKK